MVAIVVWSPFLAGHFVIAILDFGFSCLPGFLSGDRWGEYIRCPENIYGGNGCLDFWSCGCKCLMRRVLQIL